MKRRGFFRKLLGLAAAPIAAKALPEEEEFKPLQDTGEIVCYAYHFDKPITSQGPGDRIVMEIGGTIDKGQRVKLGNGWYRDICKLRRENVVDDPQHS